MNNAIPEISVVVLCYHTEEKIVPFVERIIASLQPCEAQWEIVLVGNYFENSTDRTPQIIREMAEKDPRLRTVIELKEGLFGWDIRTGLAACRGKTLAYISGDGQVPPEDVVRVYEMLKEQNLDLVKTRRITRDDGFFRVLMSRVFNGLFTLLFPGLGIRDVNSNPKIMKREIYEQLDLKNDGWFIDAEILIQVRRNRWKIGEVPAVFHEIRYRPSFVTGGAVLEFLGNLVSYRVTEFRYWFKR